MDGRLCTLRESKSFEEQAKKLGANRSQVITYCIERAWQQEIGSQREKEKPQKGKEAPR